MTFVPTTPPGPIGGSTPLVFTCAEPTGISVRFYPPDGLGAWDVVYGGTDTTGANGSISPRYTGHASRSGNTWTITPPGGSWPCPVRVWVDEAVTLPTGGQTMAPIYDVDFTALASQSLTSAGSYTIDGKTWWAKGALITNGTSQTCALVNGVGLQMTRPDPITVASSWPNASTYNNRAMCLDLSQIADYNPDAPLAIIWRFVSAHASTYDQSNSLNAYGSLLAVAASTAAVTGSELAAGGGLSLRRVNTTAYYWRNPINDASTQAPDMPAQSDTVGNTVQGIYRVSPSRFLPIAGTWTGALQTPNEMELLTPSTAVRVFGASGLSAHPSFVFTADKGAQNGTTMDFALTHLRVLQPRLAA